MFVFGVAVAVVWVTVAYVVPGVVAVWGHLTTAPVLDTGREGQGWLPPASTADNHAFLDRRYPSDEPVTWDACEPIRYAVDFTGAPADAPQVLAEAMRMITRASGLEFRQVPGTRGITIDPAVRTSQLRPAPVLIGWSSEAEDPGLGEGEYAGYAAARTEWDDAGREWFVEGDVVLNIQAFEELPDQAGLYERAAARATLAHELGHLVGLDHVDHEGELMHPGGGEGMVFDFGPGDLAGLRVLGDGCRGSDG